MPSMSHHAEVAQHCQRDAPDEQAGEEDEPMITVLLVADEAIVREGLRMRLALEADMTIVGEATSGAEALEQVQRLQPAIVLMDLVLPGRDGIAVIAALRAAHTASAVIILSWQDDATIRARAQAAGAAAFVGKHEGVKSVLTMIRHVGQIGSDTSKRELTGNAS